MPAKRSGSKARSGGGTKRAKSKAKQGLKDLDVRSAKGVRGGRKAGEKPIEYLTIKMSDVIVSS